MDKNTEQVFHRYSSKRSQASSDQGIASKSVDALEVQTLEIIFIFKTATPEKLTARVYACCSRKKSPPLTIPRRI